MGLLKKQSTLSIAVWSSILLHTAGFLGFELAFSNKRESFPKSEPRTVTIVSISSVKSSIEYKEDSGLQEPVIEKVSFIDSVQGKIELSSKILEEPAPGELELDETIVNNKVDGEIFSDNSVESGGIEDLVVITEPVPANSIEPDYPFRARKKGLEGVVVLDVVISDIGKPVYCLIADSSGYKELDDAAKNTVLSSQFHPGTLNGEEIESTLRISIRFQLNES